MEILRLSLDVRIQAFLAKYFDLLQSEDFLIAPFSKLFFFQRLPLVLRPSIAYTKTFLFGSLRRSQYVPFVIFHPIFTSVVSVSKSFYYRFFLGNRSKRNVCGNRLISSFLSCLRLAFLTTLGSLAV